MRSAVNQSSLQPDLTSSRTTIGLINTCQRFKKFALVTSVSKRFKLLLAPLLLVSAICLFFLSYYKLNILSEIKKISSERLRSNADGCGFDERVLRRAEIPFSGTAIDVSCSFLDRVRVFNAALNHLRTTHLLRKRQSKEWENISGSGHIKLIGGVDNGFLQQMGQFSKVETVFLSWMHNRLGAWTPLEDTSNILINKYFDWTADKELCEWIDKPATGSTSPQVMRNRTCISDIRETESSHSLHHSEIKPMPLPKVSHWSNNETTYPPNFNHEQPAFAFYLHIIEDCIVTPNSEVWSENMYLVQKTCSRRKDERPPQNTDRIPLYDEVMALAQYWGEGTFHNMIEVIPRMSLYIDFLKRNPQIKILANQQGGRTAQLFAVLGLSKNKIITGTCRAKVLYLPRSTMCGNANVQEIQVISMLYRNYVNEKLMPEPRNKIILIQRSGRRKFTEHNSIELMVKETAAAYNLSFTLFPDNPVPSLNKTMIMFHSAVMVVAPHGAGLSNVVFSQPGTYVIEGVCGPPAVNLCYRRLSYVLGHHWRGIHSLSGCEGGISVSIGAMKADIERYLELFNNRMRLASV